MSVVAARTLAPPPRTRQLALLLLGCILLLGASAWLAQERSLFLIAAACAALLAALLAPELVLALFVMAGALKAAPWFASAAVDLTALAALGVGAAMIAAGARRGLGAMPLSAVTVLAVALTALVVASSLWSPAGATGLDKALRFQAFSLLAVIAPPVLVRERSELARLMAALAGFALLLAATATPTDVLNGELAVAGGNEIQLGVASGLGLLAIGGFLLFVGPFPWRLLWLAPAGFLAYTVLNAGSRGALISTGLALVFLCVRQLFIERSWLLTLVVAATVAGILAFGGSLSSQSAVSKYEQTLFSNDPARIVGGRDYLLRLGKELALAHPLGLGVGGYDAVTGGLQYPHNLLLELADEEGLLGVLLTLALIFAAWLARLAAPGGWRAPEVGLTGALILFAASESMFSFDINGNRLLWFALGLAAALPGFRASGVPRRRDLKPT